MPRATKGTARRDADLSARFTAEEKRRVEMAVAKTGKNLSDFVRDAVIGSADQVLADDPLASFALAIGAIAVPGDTARRSDAVYADLLLQKHAPSNRRTRR